MNALKIQQDVLKALMKGEKVNYSTGGSETRTFITLDGITGYFLSSKDLRIDLRDAQVCMDMILESMVDPVYKLTGTDEYRLGGTARKFRSEYGEEVYIDTGRVKYFDNPVFYKKPGTGNRLIAITEDLYSTGEQTIVGCVAPVIIKG